MFNIDKKFARANVPRTVRFTEPIFRELSELANSEDISFNNLVLQCCAYALSEYEEREKKKSHEDHK